MKRIGYFRTFAICVALAFGLPACSATQLLQAQSDVATGIRAACTDVMAAHAVNPTSPVANYAVASCGTAEAVGSLVQNSATIQWLGQLQAQIAAAKAPAPTPAVPAKS